jgi:hypothetical protein
VINIIDLFDRFLLLFYEVTYRSWEHVYNLICGSLNQTSAKYYGFDFGSSVDDSAGFQMM